MCQGGKPDTRKFHSSYIGMNVCGSACAQPFNFIRAIIFSPIHNVLPECVCCCLETCNFVVIFMLMNNVCVQSFNFIQASMCKLGLSDSKEQLQKLIDVISGD